MLIGLDGYVLSVLLVFSRVGGCLMQMPGISSARVPARVRLFVALSLSLIVTPMLSSEEYLNGMDGGGLARAVAAETLIGTLIGMVSRLYVAALEFAGSAIASFIGVSSFVASIEHEEQSAVTSSLIGLCATLMLLIANLHHVAISVLFESYRAMPIGIVPATSAALHLFTDTLGAAFMVAIQVCAPFLLYAVLVHLMFGIVGKVVPQVPSYFVSVPFLAIGGLALLYFVVPEILMVFTRAVAAALANL